MSRRNKLEIFNEMSLKHLNKIIIKLTRKNWLKQWNHCLTEKRK